MVLRLAGSALVAVLAGVATTCHLTDLVRPGHVSTLSVALGQLEDSAQAGSTTPRVTSIVLNASSDPVRWSVRPLHGSAWLRPSATSGMAPDTLSVSLDPGGLATGVHLDTLLFTDAGPTGTSIRVPVMFRVLGCGITDVQVGAQLSDTLRATDCGAPHRSGRFARLYRFSVDVNDSVSVWLSSETFDSYLVLDSGTAQAAAPSLAENDACHAGQRDACLIYVKIPQTGSYVVEVTSAGAGATGGYSLIVARPRPPAAPDTLRQFASDLLTPVAAGGIVGQDTIALRASVVDADSDSVRIEVEVQPVGTGFSNTPSTASGLVASGSRAMAVDTGLTNYTSFHWQARAVDRTGRSSAWVAFGSGGADFQVVASQPPNVPSVLAQLKSDGTTAIGIGSATNQSTVLFQALVSDPDLADQVRLEVEVQPVGTAFTNLATGSSAPVLQGNRATATIAGLLDNVAYHWQARGVDQSGRAGPWASFGGNAESAADFTIVLAPSQLAVVTQPTSTAAGSAITPAVRVAAQDAVGNTLASFTGTIAVTLGANPAAGTLSGTTSVAAIAGVASFSDLALNKVGAGYTLAFSSGALATTSAAFNVTQGTATQIAVNAGNNQSAVVGTAVAVPPSVIVRDANNNPVAGVSVTFAVASGGGNVVPTTPVTTGANGVAAVTSWTLGTTAGANTLTATATGLTGSPVTFTASGTVGTATQIAVNAGNNQSTTAGTAVAVAPSVIVRDANNNPVAGVLVTFAVASGGGTVVPTTAVATSASGIAAVTSWTLGATAGTNSLTATATGLTGSPVTFTATGTVGTATQIAVNAGNNQSATAGTAVATPPSVIVRDANNNPVAGVSVTFAVASGGGTVVPTTAVLTGANGVAAVTSWTLGTTAGINTLTATATGLTGSPVTFTATGTAGTATQIAVNAGNNQSATAGTAVATPPSVIVRDASNNPVAGVNVTFAAALGGGVVVPTTAVATNASGIAAVTSWTLGTTAGTNTLTATAAGLTGSPVTFTATGTVGAATQIGVNAGNNQSATVGTAVATPPSVIVRDANNNPVSGVNVTFAVASGGGTVVPTTAIATNASGIAAVTSWTLGTTAGSNTLTATSAGLTGSPVTFTATGTAGAATQIAVNAGNNQTTTVGTTVPIAPSVIVRDASNNPVAGVSVTFAVATGGGTVVPTTPVTTAANGVAAVTSWTLGTTAGTNTLTATSAGLTGSPVTFTATGVTGAVSATQSTVTASPASISASNGTSPSTVTVTVKDAAGNPIAGLSVGLFLKGTGNLTQPPGTTNASGVATGSFYSTVVGTDTIYAMVGGVTITQQPTVVVTPAAAAQLAFSVQPTNVVAGESLPFIRECLI